MNKRWPIILGVLGIVLGGCYGKKTDKYFSEDICGQIPKELMAKIIKKPIVQAKKIDLNGIYNCAYYLNEKEYILLVLDYEKVSDQVVVQKSMQRKIETNNRIPMRNMVVWQPDQMMNSIYLIFNDAKFLTIERSTWSGLYGEDMLNLASGLANEIKEYK